MINREEKTEKILQEIANKGYTAYELAKETGLNESGLNRFIAGNVKRPHKSTIEILYNYIFDKTIKAKEPAPQYAADPLTDLLVERVLIKLEPRLKQMHDIIDGINEVYRENRREDVQIRLETKIDLTRKIDHLSAQLKNIKKMKSGF